MTEAAGFTPIHGGTAQAPVDKVETPGRRELFRQEQGPKTEQGTIMTLLDDGTKF